MLKINIPNDLLTDEDRKPLGEPTSRIIYNRETIKEGKIEYEGPVVAACLATLFSNFKDLKIRDTYAQHTKITPGLISKLEEAGFKSFKIKLYLPFNNCPKLKLKYLKYMYSIFFKYFPDVTIRTTDATEELIFYTTGPSPNLLKFSNPENINTKYKNKMFTYEFNINISTDARILFCYLSWIRMCSEFSIFLWDKASDKGVYRIKDIVYNVLMHQEPYLNFGHIPFSKYYSILEPDSTMDSLTGKPKLESQLTSSAIHLFTKIQPSFVQPENLLDKKESEIKGLRKITKEWERLFLLALESGKMHLGDSIKREKHSDVYTIGLKLSETTDACIRMQAENEAVLAYMHDRTGILKKKRIVEDGKSVGSQLVDVVFQGNVR